MNKYKNQQNTKGTCSKIAGACFFWGRRSAASSCHRRALLGDPENAKKTKIILKNKKTQKVHAPKLQGRVFSEVGKALQAAATDAPCWDPKTSQRYSGI
jgi:hypothetical protein